MRRGHLNKAKTPVQNALDDKRVILVPSDKLRDGL